MDERVELELDLAGGGDDGYRVTARSAAGEHSGRLVLDPDPLLRQRAQLQSTVLASAVASRSVVHELEGPVRGVGEALFRALFDDEVYAAYKASLALAAERGTQLRVVLRTQPSELAALPWEMMYDPDAGGYLCQREPLVRHVAVPSVTHPLSVTPPLRVLGVVSAPRDRPRLDVEGERQRLSDALSPLGSRVSLRWATGGRWADVQRELIAESWHILHFVGHGGFDSHRQEGVLVLEDEHGGSDLVGAERFSDLLTLQVPPLQLVLLNSCAGGLSAADDLFSSSAATLIRTGVSAVVAMQFAVSDPAAKAFAAGFYQAIAHNRSVAEAVRIGRIGIRGIGEETLEWVTPVLYLRGDDAALFDVLPSPPDVEEHDVGADLSPEEAAREGAALGLYQKAMARFDARDFPDAVALFDILLNDRDDYRDAADRRAQAAREVQVTALRAELREHAAAEDWKAVVAVADRLERLSPDAADPDGLATKARARLQGAPPSSHRIRYVLAAVAALLLAGGAVWAWLGLSGDDGATPPAPFRSAALWELGRHHFDAGDCYVPQTRDEVPLVWSLAHTELLKCERPDLAYEGTLVCSEDEATFAEVRDKVTGVSDEPPATVTELPAGREEVWDDQLSFQAEGAARVFWDDSASLCSAVIRTPDTDPAAALAYFTEGTGS